MGYNLTKRNPLYELIADYTVSGSAITSYTFSGLNLTKDEDYVLVSEIYNPTGFGIDYAVYFNGNTTNGNYYTQQLSSSNTTVNSQRTNTPYNLIGYSNQYATAISKIKLTNNSYIAMQSSISVSSGSSTIDSLRRYSTSTFTATSITSVQVVSAGVSGGLGIGSRFQLYRIRPASKIADVTIGSATSTVTLNNLSIGKSSEYMLVCDFVNPIATVINYSLYTNGNTNNANYYNQYMTATGTTVQAFRNNGAGLCLADNNAKTFCIANIKLTNNGYFVAQCDSNRKYSGSTIDLNKVYETSTFTSSSLTSLTIIADDYGTPSNGIGVGSRFQLYKLK